MSKITRKTCVQFGSNSGLNQVEQFGSFANGGAVYSTDPAVIQALSAWTVGWYNAVVGSNLPVKQDVNAVDFVFSYMLAYLFQEGIPEWDAGTTYFQGSMAQDGSGYIYVSITDNNLNNALTVSANWRRFDNGSFVTKTTTYTATLLDDLIRCDTTGGAFTVTLPAVASSSKKTLRFKNIGSTNIFTLKGNASENIDGANTLAVSPGNSLAVFCNGVSWDVVSAIGGKPIGPAVQVFTSGSGTWTPLKTNPTYIKVRLVGGGGGGGGSSNNTTGGAGGVGGNTSFGSSFLVANGGNGGSGGSVPSGGSGGSGSISSGTGLALAGGGGGASTPYAGTFAAGALSAVGGVGGNSAFGGGGNASHGSGGNSGQTNTGGGGAGASIGAGNGDLGGGGGGAGAYVELIIVNPAASYAYVVATGGTGGAAGSNGSTGGAGGSGVIIVEEFYE